jgi:DNA polymerase-4
MDAFYAAVEQRDNPALRGKPVIVGAPATQRGVVCASSYEARKFGVRSAMPSVTAGRLCPKGIFVYPRMSHYREESRRIMDILSRTGAFIEQMSIDEAYLDVSAVFGDETNLDEGLPPEPVKLAREIKRNIFRERGLTATIGIASNKLLSKLASDFQKPDGLTLVPERDKILFLRPMSIRAIHGVGKVTEQILNQAGIKTVGDLQNFTGDLRKFVGSFGPTLKRFSFGEDDRKLETDTETKSISSEETFDRDTGDKRVLRDCLRAQAGEISAELKEKKIGAHTVQVKIRYSDFTTLTRQITVEEPLSEAEEVFRLGCFLLAREKLANRPVRLLGIGVSGLGEPEGRQLRLNLSAKS